MRVGGGGVGGFPIPHEFNITRLETIYEFVYQEEFVRTFRIYIGYFIETFMWEYLLFN